MRFVSYAIALFLIGSANTRPLNDQPLLDSTDSTSSVPPPPLVTLTRCLHSSASPACVASISHVSTGTMPTQLDMQLSKRATSGDSNPNDNSTTGSAGAAPLPSQSQSTRKPATASATSSSAATTAPSTSPAPASSTTKSDPPPTVRPTVSSTQTPPPVTTSSSDNGDDNGPTKTVTITPPPGAPVTQTETTFVTTTLDLTTMSTVVGTSTVFGTATVTASNVETATQTDYVTVTITTGANAAATENAKLRRGDDNGIIRRRDTIVTVTAAVPNSPAKTTTVTATVTATRRVVIRTTTFDTSTKMITSTIFNNAKTTVTTTDTLTFTVLTTDINPTHTELVTATLPNTANPVQPTLVTGSPSPVDGGGGLSKGTKLGLGLGLGLGGFLALAAGALIYWFLQRKRKAPVDWYDPNNSDHLNRHLVSQPNTGLLAPSSSTSAAVGRQPTVPTLTSPSGSLNGYRGAAGPGTSAIAAVGGATAAAGGMAAYGQQQQSHDGYQHHASKHSWATSSSENTFSSQASSQPPLAARTVSPNDDSRYVAYNPYNSNTAMDRAGTHASSAQPEHVRGDSYASFDGGPDDSVLSNDNAGPPRASPPLGKQTRMTAGSDDYVMGTGSAAPNLVMPHF